MDLDTKRATVFSTGCIRFITMKAVPASIALQ